VPQSAKERQALLQERDRLWQQVLKLYAAGNWPGAVPPAEKALGVQRRLFGDRNDSTVTMLNALAALHERREDFPAALKARREVLAIQTRRFAASRWEVTDARLELAHTQRLANGRRLGAGRPLLHGLLLLRPRPALGGAAGAA
jgi:hypothetical protein